MVKNNDSSIARAKAILLLQFLSEIGDAITFAIISLSILDISKSTKEVGLVYFIEMLGLIIFTFAGGLIGDKFCRRKILIFADLSRGLVVISMILAFHFQSLLLIYLSAFLLSVLGALHNPALMSAAAEYTPDSVLARFNSFERMAKYGASVLGALIAGLFVDAGLISIGFLLDSLSFLICSIFFAKVVVSKTPDSLPIPSGKECMWSGFKIIYKIPLIKTYIGYDALQMVSFGLFNGSFLILAQRDFGWTKVTYSHHLMIIGVFTFLGGFLGSTKFITKLDDSKKLIYCAFVSSAAYFAMLLFPSFPLASILVGICDGLAIMTVSVTRSQVQLTGKKYFPQNLASLMAARRVILLSATFIGSLSCVLLADLMSLTLTFKIFLLPMFLSGILIIRYKNAQNKVYTPDLDPIRII